MWKDEHFSLFVLITLLLDIASSLYLSKEAATKNVNETFVVICRDNAGLSVAWKGPKGRLGSKTHPNVQQGSFGTSIVFNKTRVGDTGNYTCTCAASRETRIFQLIVEEDFDFVDTPEFQAGVEGKPATLRCDVDRNNVDLSWSLANGEPLKNESKVINGGDGFIIKNVSREDANIYTCQALQRSSGTIKNRNINFTVHHKPYPLYAQENVVYGFLYEPLNLTCEVEANPAPTIWWNPGDVGSIVEKSSHKSVLQLNVTEATERDYKCITSNKVGTFEKVFSVIIGVKPDPPQNVTLIAATPTSLEIWIQATNVSDDIVGTDMEPSILVIQYRPASKEDADWNEAKLNISVEAAIISDLEKNTKYEIRVATENSAGISEYYETVYETSLATSIHMKSSLVYLIMLLTSKFWLA